MMYSHPIQVAPAPVPYHSQQPQFQAPMMFPTATPSFSQPPFMQPQTRHVYQEAAPPPPVHQTMPMQYIENPNGSPLMGMQSGLAAPPPGHASLLGAKQYNEKEDRFRAENELKGGIQALSVKADEMVRSYMQSAHNIFGSSMVKGPLPCTAWMTEVVCHCCEADDPDPVKGSPLAHTIATMATMSQNIDKQIALLSSSCSHLCEDQHTMAQVHGAYERVRELIELMRGHRHVYCSSCCKGFDCCRTIAFGGSVSVPQNNRASTVY